VHNLFPQKTPNCHPTYNFGSLWLFGKIWTLISFNSCCQTQSEDLHQEVSKTWKAYLGIEVLEEVSY